MQSANAIEIVNVENLTPPGAAEYLFERDDLVQQLIKLALHQLVCARNERAAVQLATAAYMAGIPRDRQNWPSTFEEFWRALKERGEADIARVARQRAGASS